MDQQDVISIIILIILIALSGFFSASETAFTTANAIRLKNLADNGSRRAQRVLDILEQRSRMLNTILVGNNIVNLSASSLATVIAIRLLGSYGAGTATFIVTFVILVLGEIFPKTIATIHAESIALSISAIISFLMIALYPAVIIVTAVSNVFLRISGTDPTVPKRPITEGELRTIVDVSHKGGIIEDGEREMIYNLFEFNDSLAREIMVPRIDMVAVDINAGYEDLMALYRENMLTRFPVYESEKDNVTGFVNMKDVLLIDDKENFTISSILRTPHYTHEHKNTAELLIEMRNEHVNIAIVLDEYGQAAGMITMEDLLEEIVGEIRDEYDDDEIDEIRMISENTYEIDGIASLDDVNDALGLSLDCEDYDTIGGYAMSLSEELPCEGTVYEAGGYTLTVRKINNNRIDVVGITLKES